MNITIEQLKKLKESEDKVEFKEARASYSFNGGDKKEAKDRRHCVLGYVVAFANEGGGYLVFGMKDKHPHEVAGTTYYEGNVGKFEQEIYNSLKIRVEVAELYEQDKRVLVLKIPSRPVGKVYKFEDVPLMRVGEQLLPMDDQTYFKILQEQEPDFSATICEGLQIIDLEPFAIQRLKEAYSKKQDNPLFLTLSDKQILSDLALSRGEKLTYASLILLGKQEAIKRFLPQSCICVEYRNSPTQINFDNREIYQEAYFTAIDKVWTLINLRNGKVPVQQGMFIFDIPFFNQEVIREAINNAVAHRDYRRTSEVVIKQYPHELQVLNAGNFPLGVNLDNLLTVSSTPRNRLLADILAKTGIVERAGQGIDKMFYQCLAEAKDAPDYSKSDDFQIWLTISGVVRDKAFSLFINQIQQQRKENERLGAIEVITLDKIRRNVLKEELDAEATQKLLKQGLIEKVGKTRSQYYRLSKEYYSFTQTEGEYSLETPLEEEQLVMLVSNHLQRFGTAKMEDFAKVLEKQLTRERTKYLIYKLQNKGFLETEGKGTATKYKLSQEVLKGGELIGRAIELGLEEMKKRKEI